MVRLTRRGVLGLLSFEAIRLPGQDRRNQDRPDQDYGMASRKVNPAARGRASGLPFGARLVDVADKAGLKEIVIAGHPDHDDYLVESMSCGAAFLDYDNDGWLDIFLLSGSRFGDPSPVASNRL